MGVTACFAGCVVLAVGLAAGCGDDSRQCGPGTDEVNGICEAQPEVLVCGDGTRRDELTGNCVVDPNVCGDGTVLIDGTCQDPTGDLVVNLQEGPEPNGFELDATPAGTIVLPAVDTPFVIHGCIQPGGVDAPDFDVYQMTVAGPTLIELTSDGIGGLAAGFSIRTTATDPQLAGWFRLGLSTATDTASRQVLLPVAGTYQIAMTDSRTILPITYGSPAQPAAGNLDGTSCYYATLHQRSLPTPAALDLVAGTSGTIGGELALFTATFPAGTTTLSAVIDPEDAANPDARAAASLVVLVNTALRVRDDATAADPVATAAITGIVAGDDVLVALDHVWNHALAPVGYSIGPD